MNQNNLWVFGDSFSVPFKKIEKECPYVHYKGYCPKIYSELLSEKLEYNLIDMSVGGCSNYSLFHKFIDCIEKIKPNDILIFGWTQPIRFRVASKHNDFYDVMIAVVKHMTDMFTLKIDTLQDITINRNENSVYYTELSDYIKLINFTLKNNKIIHWTWVEPSNKFFTDEKQYEKTYYDLLEPYKKYLLIKEETNKEIDDFHYGEIAHLELSEDLYKKII